MDRSSGPITPYAALLLLLATLLLGLLPGSPAQAVDPGRSGYPVVPKPCPTATPAAHAKAAGSVFVGTVTAVSGRSNGAKDPDKVVTTYTQTVTVERIYKGASALFSATSTSESVEVVTTKTSGPCSLGRLTVGGDYVFFTRNQSGVIAAGTGSGTAGASPTLVADIQRLLGQGMDPTPPPPATATFTKVAHGAPPRLTRLLAPGAALVLIGLLGLVLVGRLARR